MAQYFSEEEREAIAHLQALVMRQISMGVPKEAAAAVLTMAAGQVAAATGWSKENLRDQLLGVMEQGFDGFSQGVEQSKKG